MDSDRSEKSTLATGTGRDELLTVYFVKVATSNYGPRTTLKAPRACGARAPNRECESIDLENFT